MSLYQALAGFAWLIDTHPLSATFLGQRYFVRMSLCQFNLALLWVVRESRTVFNFIEFPVVTKEVRLLLCHVHTSMTWSQE